MSAFTRSIRLGAGAAMIVAATLSAGPGSASPSAVHLVTGAGTYGLAPAAFSVNAVSGAGGLVTFQGALFVIQVVVECSIVVSDPFPLIHRYYGSGPSSLGGTLYFTFQDTGTGGLDRVSMATTPLAGPCGAPPNATETVYGQILIAP